MLHRYAGVVTVVILVAGSLVYLWLVGQIERNWWIALALPAAFQLWYSRWERVFDKRQREARNRRALNVDERL